MSKSEQTCPDPYCIDGAILASYPPYSVIACPNPIHGRVSSPQPTPAQIDADPSNSDNLVFVCEPGEKLKLEDAVYAELQQYFEKTYLGTGYSDAVDAMVALIHTQVEQALGRVREAVGEDESIGDHFNDLGEGVVTSFAEAGADHANTLRRKVRAAIDTELDKLTGGKS